MGFEFDIDWQSAGIGFGAGLLTGYAIYQSRHVLNAVRGALTSQADTAQSFATMGGDRRYTNELTRYGLRTHLFHNKLNLNDILIEPRFIPDRDVAEAPDDETERLNPLDLVPIVPDHPYLHQPYNIRTISIEELGHGERAIALLGQPGSGRTTTLLSIALWSMGKIEFDSPHDPVKERIESEDKDLSRQDRDERAKNRIAIEQRAKEQLREELGRDVGENLESAFIPPFKQMAPIYIHLANVRLGQNAWSGNVDPAEPLIRALQYHTGRVTSKTVPRKIYQFLNDGVCLLLLDGLDELPLIEQYQKIKWLHALLDEYSQNFIIVAGQPSGFGGLQQVGFTPVHLRPWSYQDRKMYVNKISANWNKIAKQRKIELNEDEQQEILSGLWGLNPFEVTMKLRAQLTDENERDAEDFAEWTHQYLATTFDDAEDAIPMMSRAATQQLDHHFFTLNGWVKDEIAVALGAPRPRGDAITDSFEADLEAEFGGGTLNDDDPFGDDLEAEFGANSFDEDDDFSEFEEDADEFIDENLGNKTPAHHDELEETDANEEEPKDETTEARQVRRTVGKLLSALLKNGLIERYQGNRYRFRNAYITGYLASLSLVEADETALVKKALAPEWSQAIAFAASQTDITLAVEIKMQNATNILHTNILDVANWLRYADELTEWRNKYLTYLGQMFVAPGQYLTNRERIAAALITTRDQNGKKVFGRGVQHTNPDVKRLSLLALGAYGQDELTDNLSGYLDNQPDDIRVAAAFAISNIQTEDAYTLLTDELINSNSESVQQVIAEAFSDNPEFGYDVLWEILNDEAYQDRVRLRRAAVLGLQRLRTDWSLSEIYRIYIDSQQWYVQSTAQAAFTQRQSRHNKGVQGYPQITTLPWLREWSIDLGEEAAADASGIELLSMALRESDPIIRYLATANSGQLGVYENTAEIYQLLNDPEDAIRDTAFRALVDLQMRMGQPLPIPS